MSDICHRERFRNCQTFEKRGLSHPRMEKIKALLALAVPPSAMNVRMGRE